MVLKEFKCTEILRRCWSAQVWSVEMTEKLDAKYGLPEELVFCKRCVMSNQRPTSTVEFKHGVDQKHNTLHFDEEGVCDACRFAEQK